ncbi:uncharacterized protein LOC126482399 isoform X1 [Schistocerca serialis cubense]|uniref:uncharacterized protein LOC126482399 isoform X1 n=1 Tax=Schistocerca serialis cubense TaxID=2023355 RepID=UPI00214E8319|nr:uncharacterized protein LOC126482399 isoform X1 [Schistocerca serialis cubense]
MAGSVWRSGRVLDFLKRICFSSKRGGQERLQMSSTRAFVLNGGSSKSLNIITCKRNDRLSHYCVHRHLTPVYTVHHAAFLSAKGECHSLQSCQAINKTKCVNLFTCCSRNFCSGTSSGPEKFPHIMNFPELVWPSLTKSLKNWILANLIIRPYFDQEFNIQDFVLGSKQAVETVSAYLPKGDFENLEGLVHEDTIKELKKNITSFSLKHRQELAVNKEDIYFSFPYQIGVMFSDDDENQKRFVEITMVYHVLRGLQELKEQGIVPPMNMGLLPEYREKMFICNYRFIREFTKGVECQWVINVLNHFKLADYTS